MARVTIDNLAEAIGDLLKDYGEDVNDMTAEAVKEVTKLGVKAVKSNAKSTFGGTGKYASGWTSRVESGRMSTQGTIYNRKTPGLPHLLEFGHAKRGGGRVPGRVHIAPVQDEIEKALTKEIEEKL